MARDPKLEEAVRQHLGALRGLSEKAMFGGLAWMIEGHLLCAARKGGLLVRLGKGQDRWAVALPGLEPMVMQGRPMSGWVEAAPGALTDDALRRQLLDAALAFVRTLPPK